MTGKVLRDPIFVGACVLALCALLALWAFVSYVEPAFSGERVSEILRCN